MSTAARPVLVVVGVGDGSGTGAASARAFAKAGYRVALIARRADGVYNTATSIKNAGGEALALPVASYNYAVFTDAFKKIRSEWSDSPIRVAVFNAVAAYFKPFLEVKEEEVQDSVNTNIVAAFGFAREAILAFQALSENVIGKKGTLIFTGGAAATRGSKTTSVLSVGKFGLRSLSQSLAKEFGPQGIHVAHVIINGNITTNLTSRLPGTKLSPDSIAKSYLNLANQDKSAWTWELDLRPSDSNW